MHGKVHATDAMTSRQRLLAAYRGEETDRLPYWAKVANPTWRTSQPEEIRKLSDLELHDYIHADGIFGCPGGIRRTAPHAPVETKRDANLERRLTRTPDGDLAEEWTLDPYTQSWHPTEFPVKTLADVRRYRWAFEDVSYEVDEQAVATAADRCRQIGQRGVTKTGGVSSPLMHLIQHVMGPVNTHLMLADHPAEMDELIALMQSDRAEEVKAVAEHTPADLVVSVENTSTTLISPGQFEKYCYRHLCDYGRAVRAAGKMHELHMCGMTLVLLELIETIPAESIEAYTSPTLGNTRLADGRARAPSKTLVGGTNVMVWLTEAERIEQYVLDELAACPDQRRIVLTTAGVAPPGCPAERFRAVGQWVKDVPVRMSNDE